MRKIILSANALLIASAIIFSACKKDNTDTVDTNDVTTTTDNSSSQGVFDDAFKISEDAMGTSGGGSLRTSAAGILANCATITPDSTTTTPYTRSFTVDFNQTGCTSYDSKIRSGKINITISNSSATSLSDVKYNVAGAVTTITFTNYIVNGNTITSAKKVVTCTSPGTHHIVVSGSDGTGYATINSSDGKTESWKGDRTRTLVSGGGQGLLQHVYDFTGTQEGVNRSGGHYVASTETALRIDLTCVGSGYGKFPTQGILSITPDGKTARKIDYGNGACDDNATVSIGSFSKQIALGL